MTLALSFAPGDPHAIVAAIVAAEAAGIDLAIIDYGTPRTPVDPLAVAAAAAMATDRIRLAVAVSPAIVEPFTFARGLAALDHLSGGRAAWRVLPAAGPFRASVEPEQQVEFAEVVTRLCESWSPDWRADDKAEAQFWRAGSTAPIAHDGAHYQVTGPLNTPRPPQGVPPRLAWSGDAVSGAEIIIAKSGEQNQFPVPSPFPGEGRGPVGKAEVTAAAPSTNVPQLGPGLRRGTVLVDVTSAQDALSRDATGYHMRIDPTDTSAVTAFVNRFAKAIA